MSETKQLPYKVKDISLADWGRKEMMLAEAEKNTMTHNLLKVLELLDAFT